MTALQKSHALGAHVVHQGVSFSVWAPDVTAVDVVIEGKSLVRPLTRQADGVHVGVVEDARAGDRYQYVLDGRGPFPDPCSRFQPLGVHGPSEVVDVSAFAWHDDDWPGIRMEGQIIYELHVGTFTSDGTFRGVIEQLDELVRLGVTAIELMPISSFPGRWNWGYDGVAHFAPSANYGRPDDLCLLVDEAHQRGLGVLLDVVYNHLGPDGNYLRSYARDYFTSMHMTPWGEGFNFDGPHSRHVRDYVISNACMWIRDYHLDGLRLDATHSIKDDSEHHILEELATAARLSAGKRSIVVIAEDAKNDTRLVRPREQSGYGLDGVWADDFHHALHVSLTGAKENYYADYTGAPDEVIAAVEFGFLYQGQPSPATATPRGTQVTDEPARSFVFCLQNHDQVGNRPFGDRLHHAINDELFAAASALLLFSPETPLIFMGQEFAASTPFLYFSDHHDELGKLVTEGRRNEFADFKVFQRDDIRHLIPDPQDETSLRASVLNFDERRINAGIYELYRTLIALRRDDPVLRCQDREATKGAALAFSAIAVQRWVGDQLRLLIANFGQKFSLPVASLQEPVLPRCGRNWRLLLSTTESRFQGNGRMPLIRSEGDTSTFSIPARSASIWSSDPASEATG